MICRLCIFPENQIYLSADVASNWFEARQNCRGINGDLFYDEKDESVMRLLRNSKTTGKTQGQEYFIGLRRQAWVWQGQQYRSKGYY